LLEALVKKWAGTDRVVPLHEFFEILESAACTGNWSQKDRIGTAVVKLTDVARAFLTMEL